MSSPPTAVQVAVGYHAAMRWIFAVVLLAACAGASALPTADPPATEDVSGLIGQPAPGWKLDHWFNSEPLALEDLRGKVVLVRWFMAPSCPFCSATAPALNRFDEEYRGRGLVVIGVYHHKDPEALDVETVRGYVEHYRFRFPVAVDPDWQTLKRWWLDGHERSWTSVSFLIDRRGVIRHVHLGGKLAPDTDDFRVMRAKREDRGVARRGSLASSARRAPRGTAAAAGEGSKPPNCSHQIQALTRVRIERLDSIIGGNYQPAGDSVAGPWRDQVCASDA